MSRGQASRRLSRNVHVDCAHFGTANCAKSMWTLHFSRFPKTCTCHHASGVLLSSFEFKPQNSLNLHLETAMYASCSTYLEFIRCGVLLLPIFFIHGNGPCVEIEIHLIQGAVMLPYLDCEPPRSFWNLNSEDIALACHRRRDWEPNTTLTNKCSSICHMLFLVN